MTCQNNNILNYQAYFSITISWLTSIHREVSGGKRYVCLWGHLSRSLEKACYQTKKVLELKKGEGLDTQPQKRPHHSYISGWF